MNENKKIVCPACQGKKISEGICECSMEWRGTKSENEWEDCQCSPDITCPACSGTGFVNS